MNRHQKAKDRHTRLAHAAAKRVATSKNNKRARRMMEGLGATLEGVHKRGFDGVQAACTYGLLRETAVERWLS